jgi:hypothetical protein
MENRFGSVGIGKTVIVYMHLYPILWVLVKHNREYRQVVISYQKPNISDCQYIENITRMRKPLIPNGKSRKFGGFPISYFVPYNEIELCLIPFTNTYGSHNLIKFRG